MIYSCEPEIFFIQIHQKDLIKVSFTCQWVGHSFISPNYQAGAKEDDGIRSTCQGCIFLKEVMAHLHLQLFSSFSPGGFISQFLLCACFAPLFQSQKKWMLSKEHIKGQTRAGQKKKGRGSNCCNTDKQDEEKMDGKCNKPSKQKPESVSKYFHS